MEEAGTAAERSEIHAVIEAAFGGSDEADLVDQLRPSEYSILSLLAELDGRVIGHILFSRMWIDTSAGRVSAVALAPVAVRPDHQREGIGSLLIERGLDLMRARGEEIAIVVGHPEYYPRFGFSTEKARFLRSPFPGEAFMALELREGALQGIEGSVVYPPAFGI